MRTATRNQSGSTMNTDRVAQKAHCRRSSARHARTARTYRPCCRAPRASTASRARTSRGAARPCSSRPSPPPRSPASPSACAPQPSPSAVRSGQAVPPGSPRQPELVPPPHTVRQQGGDVQQQQQRELEGLVGTANVDWKSVLQTLVARAASAVGAQCPRIFLAILQLES